MRARSLAPLLVASLLAAPLGAQETSTRPGEDFFDAVHAPNWLGTDIPHTSIKRQQGGTCWAFATVALLESEALRENEALRPKRAERGARTPELDISEYYVVYWGYVGKAEEWARRKGEGANTGDGGLSHDVTRIVDHHGLVPEDAYVQVADYGALRRDVHEVLRRHEEAGDFAPESVVGDVRAVLDRHLAPPPDSFQVNGAWMTPKTYATSYLGLDPSEYWEVTSYTDLPAFGRGELDVPDNWWDYDGYHNVPFADFRGVVNDALDAGYAVVFDMDWGDPGASWNGAGLAVLTPDEAPGGTSPGIRQSDFEEGRTTDDHLVLAVDHRLLDGHDWYLIKNSHGASSGRRGYVWVRGDYFDLRVLAVMVNRAAIEPGLAARFGGEG
jgi:bleomycin hydrolase